MLALREVIQRFLYRGDKLFHAERLQQIVFDAQRKGSARVFEFAVCRQ